MKNKKVFGLAALALILVIAVAVNTILAALSARVDLTAEQLYTLSPGSKAVLAKLDQKVTLKFFFSESAKDMPPSLKTYAEQVRDLLGEYERAGNGNVVIETYDPKQDSDEEEWAVKYGVEPQQANPFGAPIYFGLVVTCGTQEQTARRSRRAPASTRAWSPRSRTRSRATSRASSGPSVPSWASSPPSPACWASR